MLQYIYIYKEGTVDVHLLVSCLVNKFIYIYILKKKEKKKEGTICFAVFQWTYVSAIYSWTVQGDQGSKVFRVEFHEA